MNSLLPDLEGWIKVAGAAVAVLMALAVPVRSWIVEDRRYRAQTLEAIASASRNVAGGIAGGSHVLADSLALHALAEALRELTLVLRSTLGGGDERHADRLARAVRMLLERDGTAPPLRPSDPVGPDLERPPLSGASIRSANSRSARRGPPAG